MLLEDSSDFVKAESEFLQPLAEIVHWFIAH
jgi:hypothetical protein